MLWVLRVFNYDFCVANAFIFVVVIGICLCASVAQPGRATAL